MIGLRYRGKDPVLRDGIGRLISAMCSMSGITSIDLHNMSPAEPLRFDEFYVGPAFKLIADQLFDKDSLFYQKYYRGRKAPEEVIKGAQSILDRDWMKEETKGGK